MQYHAPFVKEEFPVYDLSHTSREGIESWEAAMTREPIPVFDDRCIGLSCSGQEKIPEACW